MLRSKVGEEVRVSHFGRAISSESLGIQRQFRLARRRQGIVFRAVVRRRRGDALLAPGGPQTALVEEDNVERLRDRWIEGGRVGVGDGQSGAARPTHGGDEHPPAVSAGRQDGEDDFDRATVGSVEMIEREGQGDANEVAAWARLTTQPGEDISGGLARRCRQSNWNRRRGRASKGARCERPAAKDRRCED